MKLEREEPNLNPNTCIFGNGRTGSLLGYQAIQTLLRERDIGEREIRGRDNQERETSRIETHWRLSPPADSQSSCCCTSTSGVFPAAPGCCKVGAIGQGFCGIRNRKNSRPLMV
jgi:hypothetical protein